MARKTYRASHIEHMLTDLHEGQWFGWSDPSNKVYANLVIYPVSGVTHSTPSEVSLTDSLTASQTTFDGTDVSSAVTEDTTNSGSTVAFGDVCYMAADGELTLAAPETATTPAIAMALEAGTDGVANEWLYQGHVRNDAWSWTVGGELYLAAAGGMTQTVPTTGQKQKLGVATHTNRIWFNPSLKVDAVPSEYMVATGGTITTIGDYKIHIFTGSGTFDLIDAGFHSTYGGAVEYLLLGGGGGGGSYGSYHAQKAGGGGGAGGHLTGNVTGLTASTMNVVVGAGGTTGILIPDGGNGYKGGDSTWHIFSATGGGGGGGSNGGSYPLKRNGGSGGGAPGYSYTSVGVGVSGQGFNGGQGYNMYHYSPGGGGGAGQLGGNSNTNGWSGSPKSGSGGNGTANSITGTAITRGGGGGGGQGGRASGETLGTAMPGGSGGGGYGSSSTVNQSATGAATAGATNLGAGGGGCSSGNQYQAGKAGGSGTIILKYKYQ